MKTFIMICGKCECRSEPQATSNPPENWREVNIRLDKRTSNTLVLCDTCSDTLKLPKVSTAGYQNSIGDQLLEDIIEAVAERLNQ